MSIPSSNLWKRLADEEYRRAFAAAQFKRLVPFQIGLLRKHFGWSQQELAERSGVTQGVISRAEDPDNGNLTANTILKIANGFDLVFLGKFVPYSELERWIENIPAETAIPSYEEENAKREREAASIVILALHQQGTGSTFPEQGVKSNVINIEGWLSKAHGSEQKPNDSLGRAAGGSK